MHVLSGGNVAPFLDSETRCAKHSGNFPISQNSHTLSPGLRKIRGGNLTLDQMEKKMENEMETGINSGMTSFEMYE